MRHSVILEGWNCRLRPVELDDAEFIVNLRNSAFAKGFINKTDLSVEKQREWISRYYERSGDYYWIVENVESGRAVGTDSVYDIIDGECMPGRWVMLPDAEVSLPALAYLIFEFVFEKLALNRALMDVVSSNKKVVRYHNMIGAQKLEECPERYRGQQSPFEFIWYEFNRDSWSNFKKTWGCMLGPRF